MEEKEKNEQEFWSIVKKLVERRKNKENGHRQKDKSEGIYQSLHS
jgi:hypothetical protein